MTIVGAGAIGGTIGAHLIRSGYDVLFIDKVREHVEAINRDGLTIEVFDETVTVPARACVPEEAPELNRVFLAVKALHTREAMSWIKDRLDPSGYVVSLQNGLEELKIAEAVGRERTVGALINFGADYLAPGRIAYGMVGTIRIGELDGRDTERVREVARMLSTFLPAEVTDNIWGFLWGKLAFGIMLKATALTHESIADVFGNKDYRPVLAGLAAQVVRVADAEGVRMEGFDDFDPEAIRRFPSDQRAVDTLFDTLSARAGRQKKARTGVWRDLAVRRRKTEVAEHLGPVIALGRRQALDVSLIEALVEQVEQIERGEREQSTDNLNELLALAKERGYA